MRALWLFISLCLVFILTLPGHAAEEKLIVLTFDDGPRPKILFGSNGQKGLIDVLESFRVPANFFMVGGLIEAHADTVRKISEMGFLIENHSYWHDNLVKLVARDGEAAVLKNIERTNETIWRITNRFPKYMRPPFWAVDEKIEALIERTGLQIVKLNNPDINTLDYDDYTKKRPPEVLVERVKILVAAREKSGIKTHVLTFHELPNSVAALQILIPYFLERGYRFGTLDDFFAERIRNADDPKQRTTVNLTREEGSTRKTPIKAAYLAIQYLYNQKKIAYLEELIDTTELNAIVIDFKVDKPVVDDYMRKLITRFRQKGVYVIGRLVVFQDSYLAQKRPELAIKKKNGNFWYSGRKVWQRYWVDSASEEVWAYNIEIAKQGLRLGFDEINFDYIRFPSDGDLQDIVYPVWDGKESKYSVLRRFYSAIRRSLPDAKISIDIFGEVFVYGAEKGIGQRLLDIAEFFDVIAPMAYPSHYQCGEFGLDDPTKHPYLVYQKTIKPGLKFLRENNFDVEVRPWIQDFSFASIYGCGPRREYGPEEVRAQIRAAVELGISGFMLWNDAGIYNRKALLPEP